ncbi:UvrD-helicase domain-containing protein [Clostridium saccharobutylicum]|uniref:UvrD/REP helicase n=1 Tax=Clostridium saccharobutylicum TaxID=169679 RepID=A0A1S8NDE9_CLOSA|nr:UvrD-helicase domain-containing protein [Clostridium saccharobutylicum]OOM14514.1 UvrD/REP helicase [Clostridium saccharobutylicum]
MKLIFSDKLIKSIPSELYEKVLLELNDFYCEFISNNFDIRNMKNGWSIRTIKGTTHIEKVYKLRVNIKDRVLFTFGKYLGLREGFIKSIVFLEFCNHDSQITRGRNMTAASGSVEDYEEIFENYIDETYCDYVYDCSKSINRIVSMDELKDMIEGNDDRAIYYLNEQQFQLINRDIKPLFLFGSAGSGKTTVSINKAYNICHNNMKIGYLTYSDFLVNEAANVFMKIVHEEKQNMEDYKEKIGFYSVNKYILNQAKKITMISYEEFKIWMDNHLNKTLGKRNINIQTIDVWREIRGIIKGLVPIDWINIELDQEELTTEFIEYLINNDLGYLEKTKIHIENKYLAKLNTKIYYNNNENREEYIKNLNIIYMLIDEIICDNKLISLEIYLNLSEKYSIFEKEEREFIYDVAEKYEQWLESNNKVDENDVVRLAISNLYKEDMCKFDYIICDEIQDLTEMQIYFLLKIVRNKENILFCGDYNQTINPTFFDTGRIEAIYKICNGTDNFHNEIIRINYRSSKNIVEFANKLTDLKIKKIGGNKKHDYKEKSIREYNNKIRFINSNNISKEVLLSLSKRRAYVDVLVADEDEKQKILESNNSNKLLFSVSNYKGLENEYIIGYNILSKLKNKWNEIFSGNLQSKEVELRYYFNLFYVFITRARNNILIVEEDICEDLLEYFKDEIEVVDQFDLLKLNLDTISNADEHYKKALRLEKNKKYMEAIESYKNADLNSFESDRDIKRCMALYKNLQGLHSDAGNELMEIGEYEYAAKCYLDAKDYLNVIQAMTFKKKSYKEIVEFLSTVNIEPMNIIMKNQNIHWIDKFNDIYKEHMDNKLNCIKKDTANIDEIINTLRNTVNNAH